MPNPIPELLAPAGGHEAACAAFEYGADGIYLGLKQFSARDDAVNFSPEDLSDIVGYARSFSVPRKVYLTLNTLVKEEELPELVACLQLARDLRVDAVIVQDFGVVRLARTLFPEITLHASTQMAIHNKQGAEAAQKIGLSRAIPARELTLKEVADICSTPGMDVEVFVHGALCYAYSGLCLFSAMEHGLSGNRGGCLYTCRNWFDPAGDTPAPKGGMPFAMKDLQLDKQLPELIKAGVAALKIEGRKKSPLYVAAVVNYYRKLLDKSASPDELARLRTDVESIFHRPATALFMDNPRNPRATDIIRGGHQGTAVGVLKQINAKEMTIAVTAAGMQRYDGLQIDIPGQSRPFGFGVTDLSRVIGKQKQRCFEVTVGETALISLNTPPPPGIVAGLTVYRSSSQDVKHRYKWHTPKPGLHRLRTPVDVTVELTGDTVTARCRSEGLQVEDIIAGPFGEARDPAGVEPAVRKAFDKLGDTPFTLNSCHVLNPHARFVPVSRLNDLRRTVTAKLEQQLAEHQENERAVFLERLSDSGETSINSMAPRRVLKTDRVSLLTEFTTAALALADEIIVDISRDSLAALQRGLHTLKKQGVQSLRLALPAVIRERRMNEFMEKITAFIERGQTAWQIANISQLELLDPQKYDVTADWPLYAWNTQAAALYKSLGLKGVTFSPEQTTEDILTVLPGCPLPGTVIVHHDVPLFNSAVCAKASLNQTCPGPETCDFDQMTLRNSKGAVFTAVNHRCETILIGEKPFTRRHDLNTLNQAGAAAFQVNFAWRHYSPTDAETIWRRLTT
ncbi:MAG: U32 family peptidase [Lentisphaeria bacterium]|nr:U32 family peptidase [Lentisphaeria bacterium]